LHHCVCIQLAVAVRTLLYIGETVASHALANNANVWFGIFHAALYGTLREFLHIGRGTGRWFEDANAAISLTHATIGHATGLPLAGPPPGVSGAATAHFWRYPGDTLSLTCASFTLPIRLPRGCAFRRNGNTTTRPAFSSTTSLASSSKTNQRMRCLRLLLRRHSHTTPACHYLRRRFLLAPGFTFLSRTFYSLSPLPSTCYPPYPAS